MSRTIRLALIGVGLVVIIALGWFFLLSPIRADMDSISTQIEDARAQLSTAQAKLAQAEVTRAEGKKNQARLIELAKMVPASDEMPSLIIQIQDLASQSGITFMSITPAEPIASEGINAIPLDVQFVGTFFDLSDFVYRAEQMVAGPGRLLAIKSLSLELGSSADTTTPSASTSPLLAVSMTIYAFDTAVAAEAASTTPKTNTDSTTETTTATQSGM
jgi:Tfp pilus assembly protein PilO